MFKILCYAALSATLAATSVNIAAARPVRPGSAHRLAHAGVGRRSHPGFHSGPHAGFVRRFHPGWRHVGYYGPHRYYYDGPGYYGYDYGYDDGGGAALALGIIGMAAGAMASAAARGEGGVAYCEQHFRSYNPRTGTYLGYDGRYHRCP